MSTKFSRLPAIETRTEDIVLKDLGLILSVFQSGRGFTKGMFRARLYSGNVPEASYARCWYSTPAEAVSQTLSVYRQAQLHEQERLQAKLSEVQKRVKQVQDTADALLQQGFGSPNA